MIIQAANIEEIKKSPKQFNEGDTVITEDPKGVYTYINGEWMEQKKGSEIDTGKTIYEINQNFLQNAKLASPKTLRDIKGLISSYVKRKMNNYYMLLCKDANYYTLFHMNLSKPNPFIEEEAVACINEFSDGLITANEEETGVELWLKYNGKPTVAYFFPYDAGVIECQ